MYTILLYMYVLRLMQFYFITDNIVSYDTHFSGDIIFLPINIKIPVNNSSPTARYIWYLQYAN